MRGFALIALTSGCSFLAGYTDWQLDETNCYCDTTREPDRTYQIMRRTYNTSSCEELTEEEIVYNDCDFPHGKLKSCQLSAKVTIAHCSTETSRLQDLRVESNQTLMFSFQLLTIRLYKPPLAIVTLPQTKLCTIRLRYAPPVVVSHMKSKRRLRVLVGSKVSIIRVTLDMSTLKNVRHFGYWHKSFLRGNLRIPSTILPEIRQWDAPTRDWVNEYKEHHKA